VAGILDPGSGEPLDDEGYLADWPPPRDDVEAAEMGEADERERRRQYRRWLRDHPEEKRGFELDSEGGEAD